MTLPRLRVRQLLILVVYAAVIGQAFMLSLTAPARLPKPPTGYAWVPRAQAIPLLIQEQRSGKSSRQIVIIGKDVAFGQSVGSGPDLTRIHKDSRGMLSRISHITKRFSDDRLRLTA